MQVYVREQGSVVRKQGGVLRVTHGRKRIMDVPLRNIEQLVLLGNIQLTTQAAKYMLKEDVDVVFMSIYGDYLGRLDKAESKFSTLRRQQIHLIDNPQRSLELARQIVAGKINNQRVILQRRAEEDSRAANALDGMMDMLKRVHGAKNLDQLRGFEGKAAAHYFDGVKTFFPAAWEFQKRAYHPSPDPANSLLSFAYTLLRKDIRARLHLVGLDPAFGFFHVLENNRPSLALDMMEEFRPSIVDAVVLTLVMNNYLSIEDFEFTNEEGLPVRMNDAVKTMVVTAYEQRLSEKIFHPMINGETEYRDAMFYQARQMRWIVEGKAIDYEPLQFR